MKTKVGSKRLKSSDPETEQNRGAGNFLRREENVRWLTTKQSCGSVAAAVSSLTVHAPEFRQRRDFVEMERNGVITFLLLRPNGRTVHTVIVFDTSTLVALAATLDWATGHAAHDYKFCPDVVMAWS